jgi:elongation factor P--(R)-beta-lysine ligase
VLQDTEALVLGLAQRCGFGSSITYRGRAIVLSSPWPRLTISEVFSNYAGWDPAAVPDPDRFETDLVTRVLPSLPADRPFILAEYPAYTAALSRLKPGNPRVAERAEAFIGGLEIANGMSELVNPQEQRERFRSDIEILKQAGREYYRLPERFLAAITTMPPSGGIAVGVDRLVMLFCDAGSIADVLAFPWLEETGLEA